MRECEEMLKIVQRIRDSRVTRDLQAFRSCTRAKNAEKLNCHTRCSITGQKVQSSCSVISRLELGTQSSRGAKSQGQATSQLCFGKIDFAFQTHTSINTPYTHELQRASRENIERETLEKNKIDSSTIFT